jgi:NAD(P)-dependent dehydrogenase (short-subunit alcohol dehydrogenase family)
MMRSIKEMMSLDNQLAVVTGGRGWLGSAICDALTELGAFVVSVGRGISQTFTMHDVVDIDDYILDLSADGIDVEIAVQEMIETLTVKHQRPITVLVNNMCSWPSSVDFMSSDMTSLTNGFRTNVAAQLYLTQQVAAQMPHSGGSIVNVGSMYGKVAPDPRMYVCGGGNALEYGASKAALMQATRYLAALLAPRNIRVNSVSPGPFSRPGSLDGKDLFRTELNRRTMLNRIGNREELKGVMALLCTQLGSYMTGVDIAVDGGWTSL